MIVQSYGLSRRLSCIVDQIQLALLNPTFSLHSFLPLIVLCWCTAASRTEVSWIRSFVTVWWFPATIKAFVFLPIWGHRQSQILPKFFFFKAKSFLNDCLKQNSNISKWTTTVDYVTFFIKLFQAAICIVVYLCIHQAVVSNCETLFRQAAISPLLLLLRPSWSVALGHHNHPHQPNHAGKHLPTHCRQSLYVHFPMN